MPRPCMLDIFQYNHLPPVALSDIACPQLLPAEPQAFACKPVLSAVVAERLGQ